MPMPVLGGDGLGGLGIRDVAAWRDAIGRPHGLCLVSGPSGSGKSTTLRATVAELRSAGRRVLEPMDPDQVAVPAVRSWGGAEERDEGRRLSLTRSIDAFPDAIAFGDIRGRVAADLAIQAVQAGILVVGSIPAISEGATVDRLLEAGLGQRALGISLNAVLFQNLVRTACPECLGNSPATGTPCRTCQGFGFVGRSLASGVRRFRGEPCIVDSLADAAMGTDARTAVLLDACTLLCEGRTTPPELVRVFGSSIRQLVRKHRDWFVEHVGLGMKDVFDK